jgi:hypothetical protein
MSEAAAPQELSLVPLPPVEDERPACSALLRLGEARDVFDSALRATRHAEAERPPHRGPGWFDSSWDLRRGCEVREGWPGDAGLRDWLEGWLYGAGGAAGGGASLSAT